MASSIPPKPKCRNCESLQQQNSVQESKILSLQEDIECILHTIADWFYITFLLCENYINRVPQYYPNIKNNLNIYSF